MELGSRFATGSSRGIDILIGLAVLVIWLLA